MFSPASYLSLATFSLIQDEPMDLSSLSQAIQVVPEALETREGEEAQLCTSQRLGIRKTFDDLHPCPIGTASGDAGVVQEWRDGYR
jgi:hypothetical protein